MRHTTQNRKDSPRRAKDCISKDPFFSKTCYSMVRGHHRAQFSSYTSRANDILVKMNTVQSHHTLKTILKPEAEI